MTDSASIAAIVLAAGVGSRMKSHMHKVLHPIAGKAMIDHLLDSVDELTPAKTVVVVGKWREQIEEALSARSCDYAVQDEQLGTGHAVQQAKHALAGHDGPVLLLFGDVPMVAPETMRRMVRRLEEDDDPGIVVLAFEPEDMKAYGRVILGEGEQIAHMVEHKDASDEQRSCRLCNSGMMAVKGADLFDWLDKISNDNMAGEYYLPDIVMIAMEEGRHPVAISANEAEVTGINSRAELAAAEAQYQELARHDAMAAGVTMHAPDTVFFSYDTHLANDVVIEPHVVFGPGVKVGEGSRIRAFSHLEGCIIGTDCEVGPYARLRPGAVLEEGAKIGNFVEMKKATLGPGAKASHLTYLGDAVVGAGANIGAGTITCNYDGFNKSQTQIGEGAFIGSNSSLVAPVSIGDGAIIGAGSVVTKDVEADAIAIARGDQKEFPGKAAAFRKRAKAKKEGK